MSKYPINISSKAIHALVIGAGIVGLRKIETLLLQGVEDIRVIDLHKSIEEFPFRDIPFIRYFQKEYEPMDLAGYIDMPPCNLAFIATSDKELNSQIALECYKRNIFCNVITNPDDGTFFLPSLVRKDDVLVTVSTNGLSPALSRVLKEDIEAFLDTGYAELCAFLGKLRPRILDLNYGSEKNAEIFRSFLSSPYKEAFLAYFADKNDENEKLVNAYIEELFELRIQYIIKEILCSHS